MKAIIPKLLAAALLTALFAPAAVADEAEETRWYEVQLLVFEHLGGAGNEQWPANPTLPDTREAETLRPAADDRVAYARTRREENILPGHWDRLDDSDAYRPLLRVAWAQPGQPRNDEATSLRLHGEQQIEAPAYSGPWGFTMAIPDEEQEEQAPVYRLDGTVTVTLGRFLHLHPRLVLTESPDDEGAVDVGQADTLVPLWMDEEQRLQRYVLDESRRMRSNELHYIDHPRFGILVRIDRMDD